MLSKLKAPSSYKRIKAYSVFMDKQQPPEVWVSIEYDAVNSFNAPLRDFEVCKFPANASGGVDWVKYNSAIGTAVSDAAKDAAAAVTSASKVEQLEPVRSRYPYVAPDGVDIRDATDEANWRKYGTTDPSGGE